jgi:hypothetical protein
MRGDLVIDPYNAFLWEIAHSGYGHFGVLGHLGVLGDKITC